MDAWVVEALRVGYRIPFDRRPPLSKRPFSAGVLPSVHQGSRLNPGTSKPSSEGGSKSSPTVSGFLQPSLPRPEGFGVVAPITDLSTLNDYITSSRFHMETPRSILSSIHPGDWIVSLDLQDTYLQVPVHHDSRRYLRFVMAGKSLQFRVLCFSLSTAPPGLHEDYGPSVRHPPQVRGQVTPLPGRLAHPGLSRNRLHSVKGQAPIELEGSPLGGKSSRPSSAPVHHEVVQCHLRRSMSPHSGDRVGVGPSPGGNRSAGPPVTSSDRSVCNLPGSEASSVFFTSLRSAGSRDGCSSPALGRSPSLCLSSDRHLN